MNYRLVFDAEWRTFRWSGSCTQCGTRFKRQTTIYQTLNPYNKNKDDSLKTREQIGVELERRGKMWQYELSTKGRCTTCTKRLGSP